MKIKLTAQTWDSDKELVKFEEWFDTFSALVRSTTHGTELEDFICHKTGREVFVTSNVPSFLRDDPDFYFDANTHGVTAQVVPTTVDPDVPSSAAVVKGKPAPSTPLEVRRARAAQGSGKQPFTDPDFTPSSSSKTRVLKKAPMRYIDLPAKSRELDGLLYIED